jgi:hypothetical protein
MRRNAPYFLTVGGIAVVFGVLLAIASPRIRTSMRGVRQVSDRGSAAPVLRVPNKMITCCV